MVRATCLSESRPFMTFPPLATGRKRGPPSILAASSQLRTACTGQAIEPRTIATVALLIGLGAANGDNEAQRPDAGNHPTATCHNAPYLGGECAVTERKLPKKTDRHDSGSGAPHQT